MNSTDHVLSHSRVVSAPAAQLWEAFAKKEHLDRWWGANGVLTETHEWAFKERGEWIFTLHVSDEQQSTHWVRFNRIKKHELITYEQGLEGEDEPTFSAELSLASEGSNTRVTHLFRFGTAEALAQANARGALAATARQSLARLAGYAPHAGPKVNKRMMVLSRLFEAPPAKVFNAWKEAKLLSKWWGPDGFSLPVCKLDFREGGAYRMVMRDRDDNDYPFSGRYLVIVPNQRLSFASLLEDADAEVVTQVSFAEDEGHTLLTVTQETPNDEQVARGQMQGWSMSLGKLAKLVAT